MKTLSIKQPWAYAILKKNKRVENRSWATKFRGEFYIHAAKTLDERAPQWLMDEYLFDRAMHRDGTQQGGIVGTAKVVDCVTNYESAWFQGPYGFILADVKPHVFVSVKGQLNFFEVNL